MNPTTPFVLGSGLLDSYPTFENLISFEDFRVMVQYIIREAKRLSRNAFVFSVSRSTHSDVAWNNLRHISGK
jgi:hypothetical protein